MRPLFLQPQEPLLESHTSAQSVDVKLAAIACDRRSTLIEQNDDTGASQALGLMANAQTKIAPWYTSDERLHARLTRILRP